MIPAAQVVLDTHSRNISQVSMSTAKDSDMWVPENQGGNKQGWALRRPLLDGGSLMGNSLRKLFIFPEETDCFPQKLSPRDSLTGPRTHNRPVEEPACEPCPVRAQKRTIFTPSLMVSREQNGSALGNKRPQVSRSLFAWWRKNWCELAPLRSEAHHFPRCQSVPGILGNRVEHPSQAGSLKSQLPNAFFISCCVLF